MKDAVATMGSILPDDVGGRDAVHVAVISARAANALWPGQPVNCKEEGATDVVAFLSTANPVGIVDPFLTNYVPPGGRFWVFLQPRTITSLRHNWTHPAFSEVKEDGVYMPPAQKLESEQWIRSYAEDIGVTYSELMEGAGRWVREGRWMIGGAEFEGMRTHLDFWTHYERVTGAIVDTDKRESFFSCSC